MPWNPIVNDEIAVKKPVRQELMQKIKDNLDYLYGNIAVTGGSGGVPNGSFEIDSDNDGIPDKWTRSLYPGGSGAYETTNPAHGAMAYRFTHPGGTGNGGGYLESDYIEITQLRRYFLCFVTWASASGMRNIVRIAYYNAAKTYLSAADVYNSTSNPTSQTMLFRAFTPPSGARYMKVLLIGGATDVNVAGTAYFDCVSLDLIPQWNFTPSWTMGEVSTYSRSWVDVASATFTIPCNINIPISFRFFADVAGYSDWVTGYQRFRIGSEYSNEGAKTGADYETRSYILNFTPAATTLGTSITITMQLRSSSSVYYVYGRKPSTLLDMAYIL